MVFEAPLAFEDRLAGNLHLQWPRLRLQRRRILTVGLPVMWFVAGLGTVSAWVTAGGKRDFGAVLRELPRFDPLPLAVCLAVGTAILVLSWAVHPARARRQMRVLMGASEEGEAVEVRYRFDRDGVTQTLPNLEGFVPWALIRGLGEDRDHLFVETAVGEEPIVIRKAVLPPETAEGVRVRVRDAAGHAGADATPPASEPEETAAGTVRVGVALTVAERAQLIERALSTPRARRGRIVGAAGWAVALSLLYPGLLAVLWCLDPYRVPFAAAFPLFVEMIGTDFWQPALGAAVLVVLALAVNRIFRARAVRSLAEELSDEAPPGEGVALIRDDGIVTLQGGARAHMGWPLFGGYERTGGLVILPMRWGSVLPLPVRSFEPEGLARFEALAARHLSRTRRPS